MHFCAQAINATTASVIAVSDDATTCASLGAVDIEIPAVMLPKLSAGDGALLAGGIVAVWAMSLTIRAALNVINKQ